MLSQDVLVDVEVRHREHRTFRIPPRTERESLGAGDLVKLVFKCGERMWAKIVEKRGERYVGRVESDPITSEVKWGDLVEIESRHVADFVRSGVPKIFTN